MSESEKARARERARKSERERVCVGVCVREKVRDSRMVAGKMGETCAFFCVYFLKKTPCTCVCTRERESLSDRERDIREEEGPSLISDS